MRTLSSTGNRVGFGLFGLLALGVVIGISAWMWINLYPTAHQVALSDPNARVPEVAGVVISTGVEEVSVGRERTAWQPVVTYSYTVSETAYTSTVWRIHPRTVHDRAEAERIAGSYAPGQQVVVHYHPEYPAWATLERGYRTWDIYVAAILMLTIVPLSIIWGPAGIEGMMRRGQQQGLVGSLLRRQPEPPRSLTALDAIPAFYNPWVHLPSVVVVAGSMWAALRPLVIAADAWLFLSIGAMSITAAIAGPIAWLGALLWALRRGYAGDATITAYTLHRNRYGRYARVTWDVRSSAGQFSGRFTIPYRSEWMLREGSRVRVLVHPSRPKVLRIIEM